MGDYIQMYNWNWGIWINAEGFVEMSCVGVANPNCDQTNNPNLNERMP
jgi:hypothetical protein